MKPGQDFYRCKGEERMRYTFIRHHYTHNTWVVKPHGALFEREVCAGFWKHKGYTVKPIIRVTGSKTS